MNAAKRERIFLVDTMGFIFRAFYAPMERLSSPSGLPTKVPYVLATMLRKLLRDWQPDYIGVVFDVAGPTFRDALFKEYKAQRPPMPEDLSAQIPWVRRLCQALRLPILEFPGYEADDVIGALAAQAARRGLEVYVVTSDKDMLQLVGDSIRVLNPQKNDLLVDAPKVEELLGVPPEKVPDVMALMGDSVDNIPGAKGIGEKGARELIQRFGSAEAALDRAAEVESKRYREALLGQRDQVLLSKKLATIATAAPVELSLEALRRAEPDLEALRALYTELGFTSLLRELGAAAVPAEATVAEPCASPAELSAFLNGIPPGQAAALWLSVEGERESPGFGSHIAALEICAEPGRARTAWVDQGGEMLLPLAGWLTDAGRPKIVHDPKLLALLLEPVTGRAAGVRDAVMLYSYLLRPTTSRHAPADIVLRHSSRVLAGAPGESADQLLRIAPALRAEVEAAGLLPLYEHIDLPLAAVLARMERHGVRVDPAALEEMSRAMESEVRRLEGEIYALAGQEFNVNSPAQLGEILYDKLGLPAPRRSGKTKSRSTAAEVLEELAAAHPLPAKILEYREVAKLKSTYVDALPRLIHPATGRVHTSFSQTGTATGRLSSSEPNLQNIPVRTELGRQIRAAFAAPPGWTLVSADYSQIELRLLAHFSGDALLVEAFRSGQDIHARTAQEVFGVGPLSQTAEHRRAAKAINFGIIYGLSAFGLAQQLGIEPKEAGKFITAYFERYRGVKDYLDCTLEEVRKTERTRTLFGRLRPIPEINSKQPSLRNFAERTALNTPLQGTAADLIKLAMIDIDRRLEEESRRGFRARMILQVHDELLFECPAEEVARLREIVRPAMEQIPAFATSGPGAPWPELQEGLRVPLVADFKSGPNWRDME